VETRLRARIVLPLGLLTVVITVGTIGYYILWRAFEASWLDALYMTITTITTIGYREVHPVEGGVRWFTMLIAVSGIGTLFFLLGSVMEYLVTERATNLKGRRMQRRIETLENHVIVAGLGRVGRQAAQELTEAGLGFVVVDPGEASARLAEERGYAHLRGDATEDEVLERAGVRRAKGLIATTGNDASNMFIVLSAKVLNPKLYVVSRAVDEASVAKLLRAGANRAISPYAIGGRRLAHLITSPNAVDFFETALRRGNEALAIEEILIGEQSPASGRALETLKLPETTGATLLAVVRDGQANVNPGGAFALRAGDYVLALGTREVLKHLERLLGAR
jgi:voltage-gated potassium channel